MTAVGRSCFEGGGCVSWERAFISQDYGRPIYKHKDLPVYITDEFDFYRCVEFNNEFYGKNKDLENPAN